MTRIISVIYIVLIIAQTNYAETWISINKQQIRLKAHSHCEKFVRYDQNSLCDCCLIQASSVNYKSPTDAIQMCANKYSCQFPNNAFEIDKDAKEEIAHAKSALKAMSVVRIERLNQAPALPQSGVLEDTDINNILTVLQREKYLLLPPSLFARPDCLKIKLLGNNNSRYAGQLFSIEYDAHCLNQSKFAPNTYKPLYILKEAKKGINEIENLYKISTSPLYEEKALTYYRIHNDVKPARKAIPTTSFEYLHAGFFRPQSPKTAKLAFDDLHFKLSTDGKTRYFSLLQTAPGKSLNRHIKDFSELAKALDTDDPKYIDALIKIKHIFYRVGYAMSELHQKYAFYQKPDARGMPKTYTHGDLHSENLFFDETSDTVTLIDNETFALALTRPFSGVSDLVDLYMLHTVRTFAHHFTEQLTTNHEFGIDDERWHELWRSLLRGYLAAFGSLSKNKFDDLFKRFRRDFIIGFSHKSIFSSPQNLIDQRKLKCLGPSDRRRFLKKHLPALFDRVYLDEINKYIKKR